MPFIVLTLTAGTGFVMWLGELITQRGIGNGMSILIFSNVVAGDPAGGDRRARPRAARCKFGVDRGRHPRAARGRRRSWSRASAASRSPSPNVWSGRRMYGGHRTYIPLKVNQSGVIPIIFASSLLYIPVLFANILPWAGVPHLA